LLEVPHRPVSPAIDLESIKELRSMRWREAEILEIDPERRNHNVFDSLVARVNPLAMALRLSWRANRLPLGKGRADPQQYKECSQSGCDRELRLTVLHFPGLLPTRILLQCSSTTIPS
jgi:hypothetical protein